MEENSVEIKFSISGDTQGKQTILDLLDSRFRDEFLTIIANFLRECVEKDKPQTIQLTNKQLKHMGFIVQGES